MYTVLSDALLRVKDRAGLDTKEEDAYVIELLEMSFGFHKETRELTYRPFWVAAKILQQSQFHQTLKKDETTEFTGQAVPIQSLLDLQANLDFDLDVRPGFSVEGKMNSSKKLKDLNDRALVLLRQYLPRGYL